MPSSWVGRSYGDGVPTSAPIPATETVPLELAPGKRDLRDAVRAVDGTGFRPRRPHEH
jgi:hypothetical protein